MTDETLKGSGWPPPDVIDASTFWVLSEGGAYHKVGQSQLPEPVPGVVRSAEYEWRDS